MGELNPKVSVNPELAKMPFSKFKKIHEKDHPTDDAEKRYVLIGGILPEEKVSKKEKDSKGKAE